MARKRSPRKRSTSRTADRQPANDQSPDHKPTKTTEEQYRLVVEGAPIGFVAINQEGMIQLVNAEVENLFGYEREELLG
jgi:PAS domain-containing protein